MPRDVETVTICRLSGARATEGCRHQTDYPSLSVAPATLVPASGHQPVMVSSAEEEDPSEPAVYEDLFPTGTLPVETCQLHGGPTVIPGTSTTPTVVSHTPNVDAALEALARRAREFKLEGSSFSVRR
jgi:hypothetical protein